MNSCQVPSAMSQAITYRLTPPPPDMVVPEASHQVKSRAAPPKKGSAPLPEQRKVGAEADVGQWPHHQQLHTPFTGNSTPAVQQAASKQQMIPHMDVS